MASARGWDSVINEDERGDVGDRETEESIRQPLHQKDSLYMRFRVENKALVWGGGLLVACWAIGITIFVLLRNTADDDDGVLSSCYVSPSCPANNAIAYNPTTGFTNDTGWSSSVATSQECCQICLPSNKVVTCFNASDKACTSKTGVGDYDYLLFDQIWLPQLCAALEQGHDPTLTHLQGTTCSVDPTTWYSNLGIHGLWPNYYGGFPACCPVTVNGQSNSFVPLTPWTVAQWTDWSELSSKWLDPTESSANNCSTCSMLNHEWQKHGACLSSTYTSSSQQVYFDTALAIFDTLWPFTQQLNGFAGKTVTVDDVRGIYGIEVNILCDPKDTSGNSIGATGVFLELQTCWKYASEFNRNVGDSLTEGMMLTMVDCSAATAATFTTPCPANVYFPVI
jgi:ribonuclease T2